MHINQRKEQFSLAYVHAVATVAGVETYPTNVDQDSIDIGLRTDSQTFPRAPHLEIQLKCTGGAVLSKPHLSFDLPVKNYNDLRKETLVPRVLVVVLVPENLSEWVLQDENSLIMHRCGYWMSLVGREETRSQDTVRVHVPRSQMFNVDGVQAIMNSIDRGLLL